jgi:hypothetical protein
MNMPYIPGSRVARGGSLLWVTVSEEAICVRRSVSATILKNPPMITHITATEIRPPVRVLY